MTVEITPPAGATAPAASVATYSQRKNYTAGDITCNSATWANLSTTLDLTLTAKAGDVVEVGLSGVTGNEAIDMALDAVSLVAAAPVNSWGADNAPDDTFFGVISWYSPSLAFSNVGGSMIRVLTAGDITAGTVVIRFRYRTTAAVAKKVFASTAVPLSVWAINHG